MSSPETRGGILPNQDMKKEAALSITNQNEIIYKIRSTTDELKNYNSISENKQQTLQKNYQAYPQVLAQISDDLSFIHKAIRLLAKKNNTEQTSSPDE